MPVSQNHEQINNETNLYLHRCLLPFHKLACPTMQKRLFSWNKIFFLISLPNFSTERSQSEHMLAPKAKLALHTKECTLRNKNGENSFMILFQKLQKSDGDIIPHLYNIVTTENNDRTI